MKLHLEKIAFVAAAAALVSLAPAQVHAQGMGNMLPTGIKVDTTTLGPTLATTAGMTLYTFGSDTVPGKSVCNGQCATNWPAVVAAGDAKAMGDWTIVTRDDGGKQWAYKGMPLYTFKNDAKAGDVMGNGRGKWMAAKP
jgi:predicted lipoprotein with Yx(FWY)xxD motif